MNLVDAKPILSYIKVYGLFGYKDIFLNFDAAVKIVAADNGAGKTTLLNIAHALLTGKIEKLLGIDFEKIDWKFHNLSEVLTLFKRDLDIGGNTVEISEWWNTSPTARRFHSSFNFEEAIELAMLFRHGKPFENSTFERAHRINPYSRDEMRQFISNLASKLTISPKFDEMKNIIKEKMLDNAIMYLPTYRRIEADLADYVKNEEDSKSSDRLIYFGLNDVQRKLTDLTERIRTDTFKGYLDINTRTLDALLSEDDTVTNQQMLPSSLDLKVIELILNRIGRTSNTLIARLRELYSSNALMNPEHRVLRGYLENLSQLYNKQRTAEDSLQRFTEVVNSYWVEGSSDPKEFLYDKLQATVTLRNKINNKTIPLNALSSGEKQIVSIFSRLYLGDNKKYFVIIDEPELSLSIDWQQRFLVDIVKSPGCQNLLAITHSPFVFQNELQPYASSLEIYNIQSDQGDAKE